MPRRPTSRERRRRGEQLVAELVRGRNEAGMSQPQLSQRAGVSLDSIRKIERRAVHEPGFFTIVDLATALGLGLDELGEQTRGEDG